MTVVREAHPGDVAELTDLFEAYRAFYKQVGHQACKPGPNLLQLTFIFLSSTLWSHTFRQEMAQCIMGVPEQGHFSLMWLVIL